VPPIEQVIVPPARNLCQGPQRQDRRGRLSHLGLGIRPVGPSMVEGLGLWVPWLKLGGFARVSRRNRLRTLPL